MMPVSQEISFFTAFSAERHSAASADYQPAVSGFLHALRLLQLASHISWMRLLCTSSMLCAISDYHYGEAGTPSASRYQPSGRHH